MVSSFRGHKELYSKNDNWIWNYLFLKFKQVLKTHWKIHFYCYYIFHVVPWSFMNIFALILIRIVKFTIRSLEFLTNRYQSSINVMQESCCESCGTIFCLCLSDTPNVQKVFSVCSVHVYRCVIFRFVLSGSSRVETARPRLPTKSNNKFCILVDSPKDSMLLISINNLWQL